MKAKLLPLRYKYYGTEVEIQHENGDYSIVEFWLLGDRTPSIRELDLYEIEPDDPDLWEYIDSSHYENCESYAAAITFIKAINKE